MHRNARLSLVLLLGAVATAASAQQVYRHVDKNGKVSFSDQPPAADARPTAPRAGAVPADGSGPTALPYELQQVVQRYPVTLYTRDECAPCDNGRSLLNTRGVPFAERQIKTNEDGDALQRLSGQNSLPLLTIGSQQLKGFSDGEWSQYLDAAGYPKSIRLPTGYRNAPPQPMVALRPAPASAPSAVQPAPVPPPPAAPAAGATPSNPAGIRF